MSKGDHHVQFNGMNDVVSCSLLAVCCFLFVAYCSLHVKTRLPLDVVLRGDARHDDDPSAASLVRLSDSIYMRRY
jgi:hypothetical protein